METKICVVCKIEKEKNKFQLNPDSSYRRHYCTSCRAKRERIQLRLAFLKNFNSLCECCGETDPRFLTLDHKQNDGNKHREKLKEHQIMAEARKQGWPKEKYQCLCFNCNCGRSVNGGICPHKCSTILEYLEKLNEGNFKVGRDYVQHNTSNVAARVAGRKAQAAGAVSQNNINLLTKLLTPEQLEQVKSLIKN